MSETVSMNTVDIMPNPSLSFHGPSTVRFEGGGKGFQHGGKGRGGQRRRRAYDVYRFFHHSLGATGRMENLGRRV